MYLFTPSRTIDFLKARFVAISVSGILFVLSILNIWQNGLNYGVDFAGGTEIQLKFDGAPAIGDLRKRLGSANLADSVIQLYGDPQDNEVLIRTPLIEVEIGGETKDVATLSIDALRTDDERALRADGLIDLNTAGWKDVVLLWRTDDPAQTEHFESLARKIMDYRKEHAGFIMHYDELAEIASPEELQNLKDETFLGHFSLRRVERVGPKVGADLRKKATYAACWSLVATLIYLWYRFELRFSIGAVAAVAHDAMLTLGFVSFAKIPFDLTVVAAILTLIGYSLNDTIVIFDRVRENLALQRRETFYDILNRSLTEMLVRTILTSATVFVVVGGLFFFGGETVRPFSLTLLFGLVVGTYSTLYIACPVTMYWKKKVFKK